MGQRICSSRIEDILGENGACGGGLAELSDRKRWTSRRFDE